MPFILVWGPWHMLILLVPSITLIDVSLHLLIRVLMVCRRSLLPPTQSWNVCHRGSQV
jgi:hypothetical protein